MGGIDAIAHHAALDARMAKAARAIRLLSLVSWPASEQQAFFADLDRGNARLPAHQYPRHDFSEARHEFEAIIDAADPAHPLGIYLIESARSWAVAAELLENLGTPRVTELSVVLFGKPDHTLPGGATTRQAANHFIAIANELDRELLAPSEQVAISATSLALQLQASLDDYFDARVITVELDPDLIAKAAAGPNRIRLRAGAAFSDYDRHQLLQHEAFVHSLTALNGQQQVVLPSMALSSPRTTATQEGLGGVRRADHRQHRHRADEAGEPAHRGGGDGAGRRRLPAGVPIISRTRGRIASRASPRRSGCSAGCRPPAAARSPRTPSTCAA